MEIQELPSITRFIPKILLALTVTVCDEVYKKIAYWLNDMGKTAPALVFFFVLFVFLCVICTWVLLTLPMESLLLLIFVVNPENYRLQSDYENNLIIKMVFVSRVFWIIQNNSQSDLTESCVDLSWSFLSFFLVWIHQFLPEPFLHWLLPQGHGATQGGNTDGAINAVAGRTQQGWRCAEGLHVT